MSSIAFRDWRTVRRRALDEIDAAHAAVGGTGRGRRFATLQVNHAYAMLVSAQFQGFCRDLHREAIDHLVLAAPPPFGDVLKTELLQNRKLLTGNPNPGNLGADFNRLGFEFWPRVLASNPAAPGWKDDLEQLNVWRNAIAHQDFDKLPANVPGFLRLATVRGWRKSCGRLAKTFDEVVRVYLTAALGPSPW